MQYTQPAARLATWPTKRLKPRSTSPLGSQIARESCENAFTSFGFLCMISMLFGTKPRLFFENSKFSLSSGAWPTGSGASRGEGFTFCSMIFPLCHPGGLHRRALCRTVGAKHAAARAFVEKPARVRRHFLAFPMAALRAGYHRLHYRSRYHLVLSGFRRRAPPGRCRRPAKACPIVRGARHDQAGEPCVDHRFGAQEVQATEYGYTAQDREPEQPAFAVSQVRERVAQHGDRNQYLSGDEKLRFVRAERAQAEERADQGEFRKADRAGSRSDDPSEAADLFQVSFHIIQRLPPTVSISSTGTGCLGFIVISDSCRTWWRTFTATRPRKTFFPRTRFQARRAAPQRRDSTSGSSRRHPGRETATARSRQAPPPRGFRPRPRRQKTAGPRSGASRAARATGERSSIPASQSNPPPRQD